MSSYLEILKTKGVGRLIISQLAARFPFGMFSLVLLIHIEKLHGSYALAGIVLAASSVAQAIAGPFTSRLMGRFGMRPVLITLVSITAVAIGMLASLHMDFWLQVVLAAVTGLCLPPIQPAVRTIYPKVVTAGMLNPLFAMDASLQEIIWVIGPVLATFLATQLSTEVALWTIVAVLVLGGAWFISAPEVGQVRIPMSKRKLGVVLAKPAVLASTLVGLALIATAAALEVAVVAQFGEEGLTAGIILAIWSAGSLAGGLLMGHAGIAHFSMGTRMLIVALPIFLIPLFDNFLWVGACVIVSGFGIAPVLAAMFAMTSASVKFSDTAEAYGWLGTGQLIGAAGGSALAGFMIDAFDHSAAYFAGGIASVVGALFALAIATKLPDLRGQYVGPMPDTEPVQILQAGDQ